MNQRAITFDAEYHSFDAVQRAAYRFSDVLAVDLEEDAGEIQCQVTFLDSDADADAILAQLKIEVLDQVLRLRVQEETKDVRNLVLALAFSKALPPDETTSA